MHPILFISARLSLAFLWITTAYASVFGDYNFGVTVLASGGITALFAKLCIFGGAALDMVIGLWLLTGIKVKACLLTQALVMIAYSLLLTWIDASFWNNPFGSLTKNIPLLFLIAILYEQANLKSKNKKAPR